MSELRHALTVRAPATTVFAAVTTPDGIAGWWTRDLEGTGAVGSIWTFRFPSGAFNCMQVIRSERDRGVEWLCVDGHPEWRNTSVRFELTDRGTETGVTFLHAGWRKPTDYMHECGHHWSDYLASLKSFCETGVGSPNPGQAARPYSE